MGIDKQICVFTGNKRVGDSFVWKIKVLVVRCCVNYSLCACVTDRYHTYTTFFFSRSFRGRIVVTISACHADDPGSIPGRGEGDTCDQKLGQEVRHEVGQLMGMQLRL